MHQAQLCPYQMTYKVSRVAEKKGRVSFEEWPSGYCERGGGLGNRK